MIFVSFAQVLIIFSLGVVITSIAARVFHLPIQRALLVYIWHSFFSFVYAWYTSKFGGDAVFYYSEAQIGDTTFGLSTRFIIFITTVIYEFTNLSYYAMGFLFGIFGAIGLLAFDSCLRYISKDQLSKIKFLLNIIIFLPSISFWSSGLGKDSIIFMSINLILWASFNLMERKLIMIFGIILIFMVRPHIAVFILLVFVATSFFNKNLNISYKLFIIITSIPIALFIIPIALYHIGFDTTFNLENFINFLELRQQYNWKNMDAGVDISSISMPFKIFTYLFRPLPFEAHSIFSLLASLENIFLIYLFFIGLKALLFNNKRIAKQPNLNLLFILTYSILLLFILSISTANLGISLRQKWMFLPFLIVLLISFMVVKKKKKYFNKIYF